MSFSIPSVAELRRLRAEAEMQNLGPKVAQRLAWLLYWQEQSCSVTNVCKHFGIGRATFYRILRRFDPQNLPALDDRSRRPHTQYRRAVPPHAIALIRQAWMEYPRLSPGVLAVLLREGHGVMISPASIRRVIEDESRHRPQARKVEL